MKYMVKTIELGHNNLVRIRESEPFLLPDTLVLNFATTKYDLTNAFVSLQNGKVKIQQKLTSPFLVDKQVLFPGVLNIAIHLYSNGKNIKSWYCLPLEVKETQHGIVAFDQLSEIKEKLDYVLANFINKDQFIKLKDFYNTLASNHNELADTVSEIKEKIKEI